MMKRDELLNRKHLTKLSNVILMVINKFYQFFFKEIGYNLSFERLVYRLIIDVIQKLKNR
jgi:hypothetical protein